MSDQQPPHDDLVSVRDRTPRRRTALGARVSRVGLVVLAVVLVLAVGLLVRDLDGGVGTFGQGAGPRGGVGVAPEVDAERGSVAPGDDTGDETRRLVGVGRMVVSVPPRWVDGGVWCNRPARNDGFFRVAQECVGRGRLAPAAPSVAVASGDTLGLADLRRVGRVEGHDVVGTRVRCSTGQRAACDQVFGVPDLAAFFYVSVPLRRQGVGGGGTELIGDIRDSLALLPRDLVAVPVPTADRSAVRMRAALRSLGLGVTSTRRTCPPTASCFGGVVDVTPAAGSVVRRGATVALVTLG